MDVIWITKVFSSGLKAKVANFFFPTSLTLLMISNTFIGVYNLYLSFWLLKSIWMLFKIRKVSQKQYLC